MGREIAAPAHSHCREHGDCIAVDDALGCEFRNESKCGTDCAEGSDREGHELRSMESEQPFEYEVYLRCQPRQESCSLIGGSGEYHGLIAGGMIPKTMNCIHAVEHGVGSVTVLDGRMEHAVLLEAISEKSLGTTMEKKR